MSVLSLRMKLVLSGGAGQQIGGGGISRRGVMRNGVTDPNAGECLHHLDNAMRQPAASFLKHLCSRPASQWRAAGLMNVKQIN